MNKLKQAFLNSKAFIPFITAGDPSLSVTEQLIVEMANAGADLIEVGIPFSDPVAEGPVIQNADARALQSGTTTDRIFTMLKQARKQCNIPLALMTYVNPIFTYGTGRFMAQCHEAKVDAVIVPDLPYEERSELLPFCMDQGITLISMIAPSSRQRIQMIAGQAQGFLYCVSTMGVTGIREQLGMEVKEMIRLAKEAQNIPCAVGFGISTPQQAMEMAAISDGIIVGSAIVKIIGEHGAECIPHVIHYCKTMKAAIRAVE